MTTEQLFHHTFTPIRADGDRRIVAAEYDWGHIESFMRGLHGPFRVEISGDLFEPWTGPLVDAKGVFQSRVEGACEIQLTLAGVRRRVFDLIDDCPHVDFFVNTTHLREAAELMPTWARHACETGDCPHNTTRECDSLANRQYRPNLIPGTTVSTQAEADERLPWLLRLPAAKRWLRYVPGKEMVDFSSIKTDRDVWADVLRGIYTQRCDEGVDHPAAEQEFDGGPKIDLITISGSLTSPTNLDHVRDVIRQCRAAGVRVWVERLGRYPQQSLKTFDWRAWPGDVHWTESGDRARILLDDPHGADPAEWPEDLRVRETP